VLSIPSSTETGNGALILLAAARHLLVQKNLAAINTLPHPLVKIVPAIVPTTCDAMQTKLIRDAEFELLADVKAERETNRWFRIPLPDYTPTFDGQLKRIPSGEIGELAKVLLWRYCRKENCAFRGIRKAVASVEYAGVSTVRQQYNLPRVEIGG
jgi:hypothetical protein